MKLSRYVEKTILIITIGSKNGVKETQIVADTTKCHRQRVVRHNFVNDENHVVKGKIRQSLPSCDSAENKTEIRLSPSSILEVPMKSV